MTIVEDTPLKDVEASAAPKDQDQDQEEPNRGSEQPPQPDSPNDPPPPYTPNPDRSGIPPSRRGPPCTCPRRGETRGGQTATNPPNPEGEGTNWRRVIVGAVGVAAAAPILATAGAALVLPAIGFASSGVVGGSIAAGIQSVFYGGATCGLFSMFQSVGATIVAPSLISTAGAAVGATAAGLAIRDEIQKSSEGGEDANGVGGGGQDAARVTECSCAACVCDEDCECACRRRRRRG